MNERAIHLINAADWRELLSLKPHQESCIEEAIQMAQNNPEIQSAIETDMKEVVESGKTLVSQEELIRLYGDPLYLIHPILLLLARLPWLIEQYRSHDISEDILRGTLSDVRIWMDVCEKHTGHPGMLEFGWLINHFSFRLFRLGRLQFMYLPSSVQAVVYRHRETGLITALCPDGLRYHADGNGEGTNGRASDDVWTATISETEEAIVGYPIHPCGYAIHQPVTLKKSDWELMLKPDDPVLDIHIAEGSPLSPEEVLKSLRMAPEFFERHLRITDARAFTCGSWLLDDNIAQIQPHGNIASFQRLFHRTPQIQESDWQTRQRVFGDSDIDILSAECTTSLQKAIRAWYESGRSCRHCEGFILL